MKIGLLSSFASPEHVDVAAFARMAEAAGFESLWLPEHPIIPVKFDTPLPGGRNTLEAYKHVPDPFMGLAVAAGATTKLRLGTAVCLLPEREPIVTAKAIASLDLMSRGRLHLGIGAGWLREESELLGVDFPRRWAQTREYVDAMKALWTQDEAAFEGKYVSFPPVWCYPKPVQAPHPPILIGGVLEKAFVRVADYGDGWLPLAHLTTPEGITAGRKRIEALFQARGRDASHLDVTLYGAKPDRDELRRWADAGVTRIILVVRAEPEPDARARIERYAELL